MLGSVSLVTSRPLAELRPVEFLPFLFTLSRFFVVRSAQAFNVLHQPEAHQPNDPFHNTIAIYYETEITPSSK